MKNIVEILNAKETLSTIFTDSQMDILNDMLSVAITKDAERKCKATIEDDSNYLGVTKGGCTSSVDADNNEFVF